ncbi:hypothetical protein [Mycobacterium palustre]|nr:hypothetical protein [Mycobacterium palustre]
MPNPHSFLASTDCGDRDTGRLLTAASRIAVNFDERFLQTAYYCAAEVIRLRQLGGRPIPDELRRHYAQAHAAITRMSDSGHENGAAAAQSAQQDEPDELITARQAATILRITKRQAQRLGPDLEGQIVDGRWLFRRSIVENYAHARGIR